MFFHPSTIKTPAGVAAHQTPAGRRHRDAGGRERWGGEVRESSCGGPRTLQRTQMVFSYVIFFLRVFRVPFNGGWMEKMDGVQMG